MVEQGDPDAIAELEALPRLPKLCAHLWEWFTDPVSGLHATRQSTGMGVSRLSRAEIRAWEHDEAIALERWERRAMMAIDAAWSKAVGESLQPAKGAT